MFTLGVLFIVGALLAPLYLRVPEYADPRPSTKTPERYEIRSSDGVMWAYLVHPGQHRKGTTRA